MRFLATVGILIWCERKKSRPHRRPPIHSFYHPRLSHILLNLEMYSTGIKTDCHLKSEYLAQKNISSENGDKFRLTNTSGFLTSSHVAYKSQAEIAPLWEMLCCPGEFSGWSRPFYIGSIGHIWVADACTLTANRLVSLKCPKCAPSPIWLLCFQKVLIQTFWKKDIKNILWQLTQMTITQKPKQFLKGI